MRDERRIGQQQGGKKCGLSSQDNIKWRVFVDSGLFLVSGEKD
jgi:hypothetical protein